jgi:hypothetical protein
VYFILARPFKDKILLISNIVYEFLIFLTYCLFLSIAKNEDI